jgi:hypothetical protein
LPFEPVAAHFKYKSNKMTQKGRLKLITVALVLAFGITACASGTGGTRGNLKRLKVNKEGELRQNWQNYVVFKRTRRSSGSFQSGAVAFLYKLKDDKKIIMDNGWIEVTTEEMKAKTKITEGTISAEIRGHNEELYGYLIYRSADGASVRIIDEKTVELNYRYNRNYSQ